MGRGQRDSTNATSLNSAGLRDTAADGGVTDALIVRMLRLRDSSWIHDSLGFIIGETSADLNIPYARAAELYERHDSFDRDAPVSPVSDTVIENMLRRFTDKYNPKATEIALGSFASELGEDQARLQRIFARIQSA